MGDAAGIGDAGGTSVRGACIRIGDEAAVDGVAMIGLLAIAVEHNVPCIHEFGFK
jgi:hypothetical protein